MKNITPIEYCQYWCNGLTNRQIAMLKYSIKQGTFLGVAYATDGSSYMPSCLIGKHLNVINTAGYYQLAATHPRRSYIFERDLAHRTNEGGEKHDG